jgi:hypothetical protein
LFAVFGFRASIVRYFALIINVVSDVICWIVNKSKSGSGSRSRNTSIGSVGDREHWRVEDGS